MAPHFMHYVCFQSIFFTHSSLAQRLLTPHPLIELVDAVRLSPSCAIIFFFGGCCLVYSLGRLSHYSVKIMRFGFYNLDFNALFAVCFFFFFSSDG